jgi:antitoxin component of RelBE/YafQ-DinJ toxin-antitoxin module
MKGKGTRRRVQSDMLNVRLPRPLKQEIERRSRAQGIKVSEAVRYVLQAWVANGQDPEETAPMRQLVH